jgi:adenine deaminase
MNVQIKGNLVDILEKKIYAARLTVDEGKISAIEAIAPTELNVEQASPLPFIIPGFIDAHVHIESSMLLPSEFARLAVVHGTVATVSDPHEIANVCGLPGVEFMIENGKQVPFKFYFGAPSCVPATAFETAGARLDLEEVQSLLRRPEIKYLSEMMNFPGVLSEEDGPMHKIRSALDLGKPVDGHAPGLRGEAAKKYIEAGISTDHECFTKEEALEKLDLGMKILIREGSAAKNFEALIDLLNDHPDQMMFCSDDKHPDSLVAGHINQLCARAVKKGINIFKILKAACINPIEHYQLEVGQLHPGDPADFVLVSDLQEFIPLQTFIGGRLVAENGRSLINTVHSPMINHFSIPRISLVDLLPSQALHGTMPVIGALDGQLITKRVTVTGFKGTDMQNDILKLVVVNRYHPAPPAIAWIKGFGLRRGAIASSVAHDSHNIVAVGTDDECILRAVNLIIDQKGGISCAAPGLEKSLALPVAGLMSEDDGYVVAGKYTAIDQLAKAFGSPLSAPFMTLSFMALLVIPHLKLSDLGLFDVDSFRFVEQSTSS